MPCGPGLPVSSVAPCQRLINAYKASKLDAAIMQDRIAADLAAKEIEARSKRESRVCHHHCRARPWYTAIFRPY